MANRPHCKFRAFMKSTLSIAIAVWVSLGVATPVAAEKADRQKPMNIEADSLRYDDVQQLSIFTGNVQLTKGTIVMRAARIEVRQDAEGYQHGLILGSPDAPAFFRQKREGVDEFFEGESVRIEYDGRADTVRFLDKAVLRRLRGAMLADEMAGAVIEYNNLTDALSVDGASAKSATGSGRIRAMITPKPDTAASAPMPPAEPAKTAPVPSLRATTTLGSTSK